MNSLLKVLSSKLQCLRQRIPAITRGISFLGNPTLSWYPVDTYSMKENQPSVTSFRISVWCIVRTVSIRRVSNGVTPESDKSLARETIPFWASR
jgi:hypothetical protein